MISFLKHTVSNTKTHIELWKTLPKHGAGMMIYLVAKRESQFDFVIKIKTLPKDS